MKSVLHWPVRYQEAWGKGKINTPGNENLWCVWCLTEWMLSDFYLEIDNRRIERQAFYILENGL